MNSATQITKILTKADQGERLTEAEAAILLQADTKQIYSILEVANKQRLRAVGDKVTYVVNYNLNLTNVCVNNCQFCGFKRSLADHDSYLLAEEEIKKCLYPALEEGITEICLVSGLHPDFDFNTYLNIVYKIKELAPEIHLHGITPAELEHGLRETNLSYQEGYHQLKEAGLDSVPGTAAEILVPAVRKKICPEKISTQGWIAAIKAAHQAGLKSTATVLYGHLETISDRVKHLKKLRDIQDQTAGFTEFIPLSFVYHNTPLYQQDNIAVGATGREDILMIAVARLFLDNIPNIQASWVKYGSKLAQLMLAAGANDLGGTLFKENITKQAGGTNGEYLAPEQIERMVVDIGYQPQQRTTLYHKL